MNINCFKVFNKTIAEESDRAKVILVAAWIDHLLEVKLKNEFSKGNAKARKKLFNQSGTFASFSAKLNTVFCAGWIDTDVYHDVQIIREIRNDCAHTIEPISLNDENISSLLKSFHVPRRQYYDWDELKAATTNNGIKWGIHLTPETSYKWKSLMLSNARSRRGLPWDMEPVYGLVLR